MQVDFSKSADRKFKKIKRTDRKLFKQIEKQLTRFVENPKHPSLRLHKLSGELENLWSISITKSLRIVYIQEGTTTIITDIGKHEEVYGK